MQNLFAVSEVALHGSRQGGEGRNEVMVQGAKWKHVHPGALTTVCSILLSARKELERRVWLGWRVSPGVLSRPPGAGLRL